MWAGESEEGSGPSVSSASPRPGVLCPLGGGRSLPPPLRASVVVGQVTLGVAGPAPHLSPGSALRLGGARSRGRWGLASGGGRGLTPALPAPRGP